MASKNDYSDIVEILEEYDSGIWRRQEEFAETIWKDSYVVSTISKHFLKIIKKYNDISEDEENLLRQEIQEFYINEIEEDIFRFTLKYDCYPTSENITFYWEPKLHHSFKYWLKQNHKHIKIEFMCSERRYAAPYQGRDEFEMLHPIMGLKWCDEKVNEHWEQLVETYWTEEDNFNQMFSEITEILDIPDNIPEYEQLYEYLWKETPLLGLRNNKILKPDVFDNEYKHIIQKIKRINKHAQKEQRV